MGVTILRNVSVLDPDKAELALGQSVVVEGGRIADVGPGLSGPGDAVILDAAGVLAEAFEHAPAERQLHQLRVTRMHLHQPRGHRGQHGPDQAPQVGALPPRRSRPRSAGACRAAGP